MSFKAGDTVATKSGNTYIVESGPGTNMRGQTVVTAVPASGKGPTRNLNVTSLTLVAPAAVRNAVAEGVEQAREAAAGPFIGPRSEVTETGNSGTPADGSVTTHSWTRNIGGRPYSFKRILMQSGQVRFSVSRYNGYTGGTAFACAWTQAHFIYVDAAQCPTCGHNLMAPAPAGHPGDDSYYCEGCGKAWALDYITTPAPAEDAPESDPVRKVNVIYTVAGEDGPKTARVALVEDYTTEADIPLILAVKHFSDNKRADLITVLDVLDVDAPKGV